MFSRTAGTAGDDRTTSLTSLVYDDSSKMLQGKCSWLFSKSIVDVFIIIYAAEGE